MKIPVEQFSIVKNRENGTVITSGTFIDMYDLATTMNREYQTNAYIVEKWIPHNEND